MQIYTFFLKYNALWQAIVRFFQSTGIDRTENTAKWHICRLNTDMQAKKNGNPQRKVAAIV